MEARSMEAGLLRKHIFKTLSSAKTTVKSMLHTDWTSVCKFLSVEHTSRLQVALESSYDKDHADGNVERRGTDASKEAVGDDSSVICLSGSRASHGVAQVAMHSQVGSQVAGVVNVYCKVDEAVYH
jgi:hypothetical protein